MHSSNPLDDRMNGGMGHTPSTNQDSPVQVHNPIELFIPRNVLAALLRDTVHTIKLNRLRDLEMPDETAAIDAMIAQREQFLAWVEHNPNDQVFCVLAAASEFAEDADESEPWEVTGMPPAPDIMS